MRVVVSVARYGWVLCVALACGCGDDDGEEPADDGGMHPHDAFPAAPCPESVPEFRVNLEADGGEGAVVARIVDADHIPPLINFNDWTIEFATPDGMPIEDLELTEVDPYMPFHNHGARYPPVVTALEDPGQFQVDDLDLWMVGAWEVTLTVESERAGNDEIVFHVCID